MKFIRRHLNNKGITLIELIVAMVVMMVIITAVTAIFIPILQTFQRANNYAEVNALMDNIAAIIMDDISSATEFPTTPALPPVIAGRPDLIPLFRIKTTFFIDYYIQFTNPPGVPANTRGILWRNIPRWDGGDDEPVLALPLNYYKFHDGNQTVFSIINNANMFEFDNGVVTFNLSIHSREGWTREQRYTARPIGLVP